MTRDKDDDDYFVSARHMVLRPAGAYRPFWETVLPAGLRRQEEVTFTEVIESASESARSEPRAEVARHTLEAAKQALTTCWHWRLSLGVLAVVVAFLVRSRCST